MGPDLSDGDIGGRGDGPGPRWGRDLLLVLGAVLPRPWLWWSGLSAVARLARRGWWHRSPFLPVPGEAYWHFRLVTAFGGSGDAAALSGPDVVAYLQWCRRARPGRG
jgi:hypothetical protein